MMKQIILFTLLSAFSLIANAQNTEKILDQVDSSIIESDIKEINEANKIYTQFEKLCIEDEKYDEAINFLKSYISILPEQHVRRAASIVDKKGDEYKNAADYARAEKYYLEAKSFIEFFF